MVSWHREPERRTEVDKVITLAGLEIAAEDTRLTSAEIATVTTLTPDHYFVKVKDGATINLPDVVNHKDRAYTIKNVSDGEVTIKANGSNTIDGEGSIVLTLQYSYVMIVSDGIAWFIIGGLNVKLEELIEDQNTLIEEQNTLLTQMAVVLKQILLHQASISGEDITATDVEVVEVS